MTKLLKGTRGITLIALVITIIVLLILAGVALSLVLGENGITERAVNAGKTQNISSAKDQLELDVANYGAEFYQAKYVNNDPDATSIQDYIMSKFDDVNNNYADGYKLTKTGYTLTLKSNIGSDRTTATAEIDTDGKVSWDGITTASAEYYTVSFYSDSELTDLITAIKVESGETIGSLPNNPTKDEDESYTYTFAGWKVGANAFDETAPVNGDMNVYADWLSRWKAIGDYFDLGTEILGKKTNGVYSSSKTLENGWRLSADWRIFSKDSTGVWLILSDYLPASTYLNSNNQNFITSTIELKLASNMSKYPYAVRSTTSRVDLITRLRNDWKGLLPSSLQSNAGITAVGALTVTEWQEGWNSKYTGDDQIAIDGDETNGFSSQSISGKAGYSNTLYFPHKSKVSYCSGYWLASSHEGNTDDGMWVRIDGYVGGTTYESIGYGVRPAVHLASDIEIEQGSKGIWSIVLSD